MSTSEKTIDYIKDDLTGHYALNGDVSVTIRGEDVCDILGWQERVVELHHKSVDAKGNEFNACVLTIWSDTTDHKVVLTAHRFPAFAKLWNGPNVIPNDDYESMLASLFHDLLYVFMEELADKLNVSTKDVRKWADDILYAIWSGAARNPIERLKARIGYGVCRAFGGIFRSLTKWFIFIVAILAFVGCCVPDWTLEDVQGEEQIEEAITND